MKNRDKKRLKKFRRILEQTRVKKGLSQRALSNKCQVGHGKISKLENVDSTNLNLTTLFELAKGLSIHPRDLIDYEVDWVIKND